MFLHQRGLTENPKSTHCEKPASLEHIQPTSQPSLVGRKFIWRHDQILDKVAADLEEEKTINSNNIKTKGPCFIRFVKPGERPSRSSSSKGLLVTAQETQFPEETTSSVLRPDICICLKQPDCIMGGKDGGGQ